MSEPGTGCDGKVADPLLRVERLAAMGVVSWLPRADLPGAPLAGSWCAAPPAQACVGRAESAPAAIASRRPASEPRQPRSMPDSARQALTKGTSSSAARPAARSPDAVAVPAPPPMPALAAQSGPAVRLELQRLQAGRWILFWWLSGSPAARERAFAADLVYALGAVPEALPGALVLEWPGRANQQFSGADDSLAAALNGFLGACSADPTQTVSLVSVGGASAQGMKLADCLPAGVQLLELPTVHEMIHHPGRKPDAWKLLAQFLATD